MKSDLEKCLLAVIQKWKKLYFYGILERQLIAVFLVKTQIYSQDLGIFKFIT